MKYIVLSLMVCASFNCAGGGNETGWMPDSGFEVELSGNSSAGSFAVDYAGAPAPRSGGPGLSTEVIDIPPIRVVTSGDSEIDSEDSEVPEPPSDPKDAEPDPELEDAEADSAIETDAGTDSSTDSGTDSGVDAGTDSSVDSGTDSAVDSSTDSGVDSGTDSGTDSAVDSSTDSGLDAGTDSGTDSGYDAGQPICEVTSCDIGDGIGTQLQQQSFASVETLSCTQGEEEWTEERICDLTDVCVLANSTLECRPCEQSLLSGDTMTTLVYGQGEDAVTKIDCLGCRCGWWWPKTSGPGCPTMFPRTLSFIPAQRLPEVTVRFDVQITSTGYMTVTALSGTQVIGYAMNFFDKDGLTVSYEFTVSGLVNVSGDWVRFTTTARLYTSCDY